MTASFVNLKILLWSGFPDLVQIKKVKQINEAGSNLHFLLSHMSPIQLFHLLKLNSNYFILSLLKKWLSFLFKMQLY